MVRNPSPRVLLVFLIFLIAASGCISPSSSPAHPDAGSPSYVSSTPPAASVTSSPATPPAGSPVALNPAEENISVVRQVVKEFHATHTYNASTMYTCVRMAEDLWDVLTRHGINARIYVGNISENISSIRDADHAWVLAQVGQDSYVAIEATGGFLVCPDPRFCSMNDPFYYRGFAFGSPEELEAAMEKARHPCPDGYVFGNDSLCHPACGDGYCANGSFCVSGQCRKCAAGYVVGEDLLCHPECPAGSGRYCSSGVCRNGACLPD